VKEERKLKTGMRCESCKRGEQKKMGNGWELSAPVWQRLRGRTMKISIIYRRMATSRPETGDYKSM